MKRATPCLLLLMALLAVLGLGVLVHDPEGTPPAASPGGATPARPGGAIDAQPEALAAAGELSGAAAEAGSQAAPEAPGVNEADAPAGPTDSRADAEDPAAPRPGSIQDLIGALRARRAPQAVPTLIGLPGGPPLRSARAPGAPTAWVPGADGRPAPVYTPEERAVLEAEAEEVRSRRGSVVGALEEVGPGQIAGWAYDWADPQAVLTVALFVDGFPLLRVAADQARAGAPGPAAARGFSAAAPPLLADGEAHTVQAVVVLGGGEEALELRRSPRRVGGERPARGRLRLDPTSSPPTASGWAEDPDRADPLQVRILVDGQLLARVPADGQEPDAPAGRGFRLALPGLDPQRAHVVQALIEDLDHPGLLIECRDSPARLGEGTENQLPIGGLTFVDAQVITGWARDPDAGAAPIEVQVSFDGGPARRLLADQDFPALANAGQPSTRHLFRVEVPAELQDGRTHLVSVFALDSAGGPSPELTGSPASFKAAVNAAPVGFLDVADHHTIAGWAYDADLGAQPVQLEVWIDGAPWQVLAADRPRPDLVPVASAEPGHGFHLDAPERLRDGRFHTVRVLARNHPDGPPRELTGSPRELGALRPWLGITATVAADGRLAIASVVPDSPAARADLRAGDVLLTLDGAPAPADPAALAAWIGARVPGQVIAVGLERQEPLAPPPADDPQATRPVVHVIDVALEERIEGPAGG